jgi:hypothetical protein
MSAHGLCAMKLHLLSPVACISGCLLGGQKYELPAFSFIMCNSCKECMPSRAIDTTHCRKPRVPMAVETGAHEKKGLARRGMFRYDSGLFRRGDKRRKQSK